MLFSMHFVHRAGGVLFGREWWEVVYFYSILIAVMLMEGILL